MTFLLALLCAAVIPAAMNGATLGALIVANGNLVGALDELGATLGALIVANGNLVGALNELGATLGALIVANGNLVGATLGDGILVGGLDGLGAALGVGTAGIFVVASNGNCAVVTIFTAGTFGEVESMIYNP